MKITGDLYKMIESGIHTKLQEIVTDLRTRTDSLQNKSGNKESFVEHYVYNKTGKDPETRAFFDLYYMSRNGETSLNSAVCTYKCENSIRDINDSHLCAAVKKAFSTFEYIEPDTKVNNVFIEAFKQHFDKGDQWGSVMIWAFALCDWLEDNTSGCEGGWEFEQSCAGSDMEDYQYELINELVDMKSEQSFKDLYHFEKVLLRYKNMLELAELNY